MTTYLDSVDALLRDDVQDVTAYADRAMRVLRHVRSPETWARVYERGLEASFRRHDMDGLAALASLAIARFDALGGLDQALAHIDFALAMADGLPDAIVLLESFRASAAAGQGDLDTARLALASAKTSLPRVSSPRSSTQYRASSAVVACVAADVASMPTVRQAVGAAEQAGDHGGAAHLMSWLIPLMFAAGKVEEAEPWNQALRLHAQTIPHRYREADAESFAFAKRAAWGPLDVDVPYRIAAETGNWLAMFRLCVIQVRNAALTGNWAVAEQMLARLGRVSTRTSRGFADLLPYFSAVIGAYQSGAELDNVPDPPPASLMTLGALLAGGEAVAIAGTQRDALTWLAAIEQSVPVEVRTSLEWPVSRDRITGLLRVRAGSVREGVRAFREAIDWASAAGYESEVAIAQVQLAEVLSLAEVASSERARTRQRRAGWLKLQELGINPTPHAYAATRALALRQDASVRPQLTPRQVEVLALLAEGLSYRDAADRLGTSWRTVSTQAYQAYERLGVSGKWEAVRAARRLQIL